MPPKQRIKVYGDSATLEKVITSRGHIPIYHSFETQARAKPYGTASSIPYYLLWLDGSELVQINVGIFQLEIQLIIS